MTQLTHLSLGTVHIHQSHIYLACCWNSFQLLQHFELYAKFSASSGLLQLASLPCLKWFKLDSSCGCAVDADTAELVQCLSRSLGLRYRLSFGTGNNLEDCRATYGVSPVLMDL